jgi:hypothetical protein
MYRPLIAAVLLTAFFFLTGCATPGVQTSSFSDSNDADAASITGRWVRESPFVWEGFSLLAVNDKFISAPMMDRAEHVTAKVAPGTHKLAVKAIFNRGMGGGGPYEAFIPLTAELKPSAKYRIAGKVTGTAVEAWLEDAETKERMSSVAMAPFGKQAVQAGAVPIFIPVRR